MCRPDPYGERHVDTKLDAVVHWLLVPVVYRDILRIAQSRLSLAVERPQPHALQLPITVRVKMDLNTAAHKKPSTLYVIQDRLRVK
jgi:hypothetical protein